MLVVIPAHNESASLAGVIDELRRRVAGVEILVVDDGSDDGSERLIASLGVRYLRFPVCLGVGSAMRAGIRFARRLGHDTVVRVDADGQHCADQLEELLKPLAGGEHDVAHGSRYSAPSAYRTPLMRRVGQRVIALLLSRLTGERVTDPTSGFWAFGPRAVELLAEHHPTGYGEPELRLLLHRNGLRVREVAVNMRGRTAGRSSLTVPRAALAIARMLLAMIVVPLRHAVGTRAP
jgi:glycosyltransferase involved in cell wall biosynthesis